MPIPAKVVMVVEDDRNVLDITTLLLEAAGYVVLGAANAAEGVRTIGGHVKVDLIFSDVNMPGVMDGIDMVHELRRTGFLGFIVMVSGDIVTTRARLAPDMHFLAKPYDRRALLDAVSSAMLH
jgi:CheY-like chemotaxis protein